MILAGIAAFELAPLNLAAVDRHVRDGHGRNDLGQRFRPQRAGGFGLVAAMALAVMWYRWITLRWLGHDDLAVMAYDAMAGPRWLGRDGLPRDG